MKRGQAWRRHQDERIKNYVADKFKYWYEDANWAPGWTTNKFIGIIAETRTTCSKDCCKNERYSRACTKIETQRIIEEYDF